MAHDAGGSQPPVCPGTARFRHARRVLRRMDFVPVDSRGRRSARRAAACMLAQRRVPAGHCRDSANAERRVCRRRGQFQLLLGGVLLDQPLCHADRSIRRRARGLWSFGVNLRLWADASVRLAGDRRHGGSFRVSLGMCHGVGSAAGGRVDPADFNEVKARLKRWIFGLAGKEPEAVVVSFCSGEETLAKAMCEEIRRLEPSRRHFSVEASESYREIRKRFRRYRIGLAPVLFTPDARYRRLRRAAFLLAPAKILAYSARLERHHLKLTSPVASWLFLRGVPLDRIFLRPRWLWPWRKDRTIRPQGHKIIEGRPRNPKRRSLAVLTPYFPYPLSHGGAVRMFHLLREAAREFDVVVYAFTEGEIAEADLKPVLEFVVRVYLVPKPRYREPRWSTLLPPEVGEYRSPEMERLLRSRQTDLLQVEYTYLASYGGDILVEHDVTYDLYAQVRERRRSFSAWWDWWRWHRYERRAIAR